jgi:hypothetical protein
MYAEPIDRLINNAAIMAEPYSATEDGLELEDYFRRRSDDHCCSF